MDFTVVVGGYLLGLRREMLPVYALGAVVGLLKNWVPAVGIVALSVGLGLMLAHSPERVLTASLIVVLLVLRQMPWAITNALKRRQRPGWPSAWHCRVSPC